MRNIEKKFVKWAKKNQPPKDIIINPFAPDKYELFKFAKKIFKAGYIHGRRATRAGDA